MSARAQIWLCGECKYANAVGTDYCRNCGTENPFTLRKASSPALPGIALAEIPADLPPTTGRKYDAGKPRMDLIPAWAEWEVAKVLEHGAKMHSARNWESLDRLQERFLAAAKRHINEFQRGNTHDTGDKGSGLHHLAHAVCSLMFVLDDWLRKEGSA